jgi:hypothetical protein
VFTGFIAVSHVAGILMALAVPGEKSVRRLLLALTLALHWPLQSLAMAARALCSLLRRPHYWAKTPHEVFGQEMGSDAWLLSGEYFRVWPELFRGRNVQAAFP